MPPMNAWSLLYEELKMKGKSKWYYDYDRNDLNRTNPNISEGDPQDFWKEDGISLTGNPLAADDTVTIFGGKGTDTISLQGAYDYSLSSPSSFITGQSSGDTISFTSMNKDPNRYKYDEDVILKELKDYISGTYNQHYSAGSDKIQTLDLIEACGDGEAFCRSNILKYASRYDKKGTARRDIMKILHYAVLLMHFNDKNAQRETYPQ